MALLMAEPGTPLSAATAFRRSIAGCESNVAIGLARLGHRSGWFGRVGDDAFGHGVLRAIRGEGVDVGHARVDPGAPTGLLVRDVGMTRPIEVLYFRSGSAGSRLAPSDVDSDYVASARILHVSGITPLLSDSAHQATLAAIAAAKSAGTTVSFDPNIRLRLATPERIREVLPAIAGTADLVFTGSDEAELLGGERGPSVFLDAGAETVVVKHGSAGASATDGVRSWHQPVVAVAALDPVGAGDAFAAGYLSGILAGLDTEGSLHRAAAMGAAAVTAYGDVEGLPYEHLTFTEGRVRR